MYFFNSYQVFKELQVNGQEVEDEDNNTISDYTSDADTNNNNQIHANDLPPTANPAGEPNEDINENEDNQNTDYTQQQDTENNNQTDDESEDYTIPDNAAPENSQHIQDDSNINDNQDNTNNADDNNDDITDYTANNGTDDSTTDTDGDGTTDYTADAGTDDINTENDDDGADIASGDNNGDNTTDYTNENDGTDTVEDNNTDDNTDDNSDDTSTDSSSDDELKQMDSELFSNLTEEEMKIKNKTLKNQFLEMYETCSNIISAMDSSNKDLRYNSVFEYITDTLNDLRTMIVDYIDSIFDSKAYIENAIYYNRCLATLAGINKVLKELEEKEENDGKKL